MRLNKDKTRLFWSYVEKRGREQCWLWKGGRNSGYGSFWLHGKQRQSHIVAFLLSGKKLSRGQIIRHSCDNPPCCNPRHLVAGTHRDNAMDRARRLRGRRSVTPQIVKQIRNLFAWKTPKVALAKRFKLHRHTITQIVNRITWKFVR